MQLIPYVVESIVIIDIILLVLQTQFIDHKVHLSINFKYELFLVITFYARHCGIVGKYVYELSQVPKSQTITCWKFHLNFVIAIAY